MHTREPYIVVSRGAEFADSFDVQFFAKTFPSLFPLGSGGPRRAEESISDVAEGERASLDSETLARQLVSTRNMSLGTWMRVVLRRHGGKVREPSHLCISGFQHSCKVEKSAR